MLADPWQLPLWQLISVFHAGCGHWLYADRLNIASAEKDLMIVPIFGISPPVRRRPAPRDHRRVPHPSALFARGWDSMIVESRAFSSHQK